MWFGKLSLKVAALALVGAVSAMAAKSTTISSLTFGDASTDAANWAYLLNYKLWGQTEISFGNNNKFPKPAGWVGSATGDLLSTGNDAQIAGTVIVGGKIDNTNKMAFTTGPVRYGKGITDGSRASGTKCSGTTTSGACAEVPLYKDIKVPTVKKWPSNLESISVPNHGTYTIDVTSGSTELYFNSITFGQESTLLIKMPAGGVFTSIITKHLNIPNDATHPKILVQYEGENLPRCHSPSYTCGGEYEGNLLIYVDDSFTLRNIDYQPIDGTIISSGKIEIVCNMGFSGQLLAKELVVGNEVNGEGFQFTPIVHEDPEIVLSQTTATFEEDNKWHEIGISLNSDEGEEDVTFDYCFEFNETAVKGQFAEKADIKTDTDHKFPICGTDSPVTVTIPKGKTVAQTAANKIYINPVIDGIVESPKSGQPGEKLWLKISNVKHAKVSTDNYDESIGGFNIYIKDVDKLPQGNSSLNVSVKEDAVYTFAEEDFGYQHSTRTFVSVKITVMPTKGSLLLNGSAVKKDQVITVANLGKLTYKPVANEFSKTKTEVYTSFKFRVIGSGTGDNTSEEYTANVNVIPVNDAPTTDAEHTFTVSENPSKDELLGSISYSDVANELSVDSYTFTLVSEDAACTGCFVLTSSGDVKVKGSQTFDFYTKSSYKLTAKITDDAKTEKNYGLTEKPGSKNFTIVINVKNQNHAPTISNQSFTLPEKNKTATGIVDWTSAKVVGTVSAKDVDGENLTFKVVTADIPFTFKNGTSSLTVLDGSKLDYETKSVWTFKVSVTDPSGASATATITVNLQDVNEDPIPSDVKSEYTVKENTATGKDFGSFTVTDNDAGDKLTYKLSGVLNDDASSISGILEGKTLADIFYVDEPANSTGKRTASIRVKSSALLDYEELYKASSRKPSYPVTITITDKASNSVDVTTKITVVDVNEDLTATGGTFYIQEHSPGLTHVCTKEYGEDCSESDYGYVTGTDTDKYNKSFSTLTFSKSTANTGVKATDAKNFVVDPDDGSISTAANAEFEYDGDGAKISYTFLVTVSDGTFSKDVSVTVKVLNIDEPPVKLVTEGSGKIREDAKAGTNAATFDKKFITDETELAKFEALGDDVLYTINETASGYGVFKANVENGEINLLDPTKIDFETLCAKDDDCKSNVTLGKSPMYEVLLTASNKNGSVSLDIRRSIEIVDVNEPPTASDLEETVDENIAGGTVIGTIEASDPDKYASCRAGSHSCGFNVLHYSIVDATGLPFEIDQNTGDIKLKKNERLRYIDKQQYEFDVKVSDRATTEPALSTIAHVTIKVNDVNEDPEIRVLADLYEVKENTDVGTKFGDKIVVYDEDAADVSRTTDANPALKISIKDNGTCTAGKNCAQDLFNVVIVKNTDANHETQFQFVVKSGLDYEALYKTAKMDAIFDVTLTVTDKKGNKVSQDTKVRVIDENEEPEFTGEPYKFTVSENVKTETLLGTVEASDPDIYNTNYGTLYFSLDATYDDAALFDIDRKTGELYVVNNANLNYEEKSEYKFKVIATDKEYTISTLVTVTVDNEDEGPVFPTVPELYVDENTPKGTIATLKNGTKQAIAASDDDCSNRHTCKAPTYTLVAAEGAPDDFKAFSIDADGFISVAKDNVLNYEKQNKYVVRVVATDGSDPTLTDEVDVTIHVRDVNDAPVFELVEYPFEVDENKPAGEVVGAVVATDEDTWSKLTFEIADYKANSGDSKKFTIDASGKITTTEKLNYEDQATYELLVTVTDNGSSKGFEDLSATTKVVITVNDKPDDPIIIDDKKNYEVAENTAEHPIKDATIVCYDVSDEDQDQEKSLAGYVVDVGGTDADRLFDAKVKKDGSKYKLCLSVKTPSKFNYEALPHEHSIKVGVIDSDERTHEIAKTIKIVDVNEMPIISGSLAYSFYENKGEGYVIGKFNSADVDTAKGFTDNVFSAIGGDTDLFTITEDGKIKALRDFDYEKEKVRTFELEIALSDRNKTKYPELTTKTTITITLKDVPEVPQITSTEFSVRENPPADTLIGIIEATDPDGEGELLFSLAVESPYVTVKPNGEIHVKEGAVIDYEKMQKFTITVTVKDADGLEFDGDIVINVIDVNEPPKIEPQEFTFPEDSKPGTKKGPVEAKDPDTKNKKFNDLKYYPVTENDKFEIKTNGDIVLKGELDYEKEKSYVIKVYVTDGEFTDTTDITVKVGNVIEKSQVEITRVEAGDSVYIKPNKEIYTNQEVIEVEWTQDGKTMTSLDTLKEGCQKIIKSYKDPSKDVAGADTIDVCYSTAAPKVDVDATKTKVTADNIYTIVEGVDKKDSSIYVNDKTKDVKVTVEDTVSHYKESFNVTVVLDTISVADKTVKEMVEISKSEITLEKNPKSDVKTSPIGNKTKVSYDKVVNGDSVVVSYYVDDKGEIIKSAVVDENGEKSNIAVIEVSKTVDVKGKKVVVSYKADAETGKILYGDSEGNLMYDTPKSSSSKESKDEKEKSSVVDLKTGVGAFTVTYDAKGVEGNKSTVSYVIDEKGKIVANEEGDRGYLVTYTYTNKYGNSADKSVFMVLDRIKPIVKILTPADGDVVFANYVDVDWCVAIDGDEKNCVKQDSLNFQSLNKGPNTIKRIYRDKAGNETIAEINVMMKKAKDVNINLEEPMIIVSIDSVNKYYAENPPEKDQRYAVSILNTKTQKESEVIKGTADESKKGSGDEPYPGYEGHIGPTISIDMKLPLVSAVGGLATLDDIIINGNMVPLEDVDADNSEKVTVDEYVEKYCSTEFREELGKDYSKARLYSTNARVTLWFYTTGGQFVDKYQYNYDIDDPDYVDKAGLVKMFFEMKPDVNGELRDKSGRLYGTGPYIVKTKVDIRSKLRCAVPPVAKSKVGDVLKTSDEMLKRFGYRRPVLRGNEKHSSSAKKEDKKDSKSDSKKESSKK
ncbi:cadherin repeat domain-containing protein [Fibrobacter succinogenes]|uniref:Cadherin domain-containing protein n=1 Tax=Fibrobacter succinogenes TaxID=833 RepID=A0A380RXC8_FIBSU|nr:cadherin repeat domain-containing protein [Fibrobacter succinogenes]PWJ37672.1 cadherin domain-containing protein [Fibrobacter succinogenes subsp. elongatus]SUQ19919.1 Cadherin domain-containing protein [Fibrobacter succinogenes]